jgi:hypothetical protein
VSLWKEMTRFVMAFPKSTFLLHFPPFTEHMCELHGPTFFSLACHSEMAHNIDYKRNTASIRSQHRSK